MVVLLQVIMVVFFPFKNTTTSMRKEKKTQLISKFGFPVSVSLTLTTPFLIFSFLLFLTLAPLFLFPLFTFFFPKITLYHYQRRYFMVYVLPPTQAPSYLPSPKTTTLNRNQPHLFFLFYFYLVPQIRIFKLSSDTLIYFHMFIHFFL